MQPQLLLLDEPTSQLDPVSSEELLAAIRRLSEDTGSTIVLSEHRTERCLHIATRVLSLDGGALVADADPQGFASWALEGRSGAVPPVTRLFARRHAPGEAREHQLPMTVKDARRLLLRGGTLRPLRRPPTQPASAGATALEVRKLTVGYDRCQPLLENLSFTLRRGEIIAFMGENGAGKSTLIRHFIGLAKPFSGTVTLLGREVAKLSVAAAARDCALMGQNPSDLFVKDTVAEEIAFTLTTLGIEGEWHNALMEKVVDELDISTFMERNPATSRAASKRASRSPQRSAGTPMVVLDEPTRGMDAQHKESLTRLLRRWSRADRCIALVTHDVELAASVADRIIILGDRGVLADGPAAEVLDGSLFFSTQINRLLRHAIPYILCEEELMWEDEPS